MRRIINRFLGRFGYRITKLGGVDPFVMQQRLLGETPAPCVVDVGAYHGDTIAKYKALMPNATIFAYEPFADSCARVKARFDGDRSIHISQCAVADRVGTTDFFVHADKSTNSFNRALKSESGESVTVETTTLDEIFRNNRLACIDILKLDVEGSELRVLDGAAQVLACKAINLIYAEVMFQAAFAGGVIFYDVCRRLYGHDFDLFDFFEVKRDRAGACRWGNALFRRRLSATPVAVRPEGP